MNEEPGVGHRWSISRWCVRCRSPRHGVFLLLGLFAGTVPLLGQNEVYQVSTLFRDSSGAVDGPGAVARFSEASGLVVVPDGTIFVADRENHVIRRVSPTGHVSTALGVPTFAGEVVDSTFLALTYPTRLGADARGDVYLIEDGNLYRIGTGDSVSLGGLWPGFVTDVAISGGGEIYLALPVKNQVWRGSAGEGFQLWAGDPAGTSGIADGQGANARFFYPEFLALAPDGALIVVDRINFTLRRISLTGVVTTLAGVAQASEYVDGPVATARLREPADLAVDSAGNIYFVDGPAIRRLSPGGIVSTVAGNQNERGFVDATGPAARFTNLVGLDVQADGTLVVSDNNTVRRVTTAGAVTTLAGVPQSTSPWGPLSGMLGLTGGPAGELISLDSRMVRRIQSNGTEQLLAGSLQTIDFWNAGSPAADSQGNVYVTGRHTVRKITPNGVISILAGALDEPGFADGTGTAARFNRPLGVELDAAGNVYVADSENEVIRKITPAGVVSTFAGKAGESGLIDGLGAEARFLSPSDVAVDRDGDVWVADFTTVRRISPAGQVVTIAGIEGPSTDWGDGIGTAARFMYIDSLDDTPDGGVIVTDRAQLVRKVGPDGRVTSIAGLGGEVGAADGRGAEARFNSPTGIHVDPEGVIFVADAWNEAIRRIEPVTPPTLNSSPTNAVATIGGTAELQATAAGSGLAWRWVRDGQAVAGASGTVLALDNLQPAQAGLYQAEALAAGGATRSSPAIVGVSISQKVAGQARELSPANIVHPNGNVYDQLLLEGQAAAFTADPGQVTRLSFLDPDDDIVQIEFSGPGTVNVVLAEPAGPSRPRYYDQAVDYMQGLAGIVVVGANENTHLSVFSVGRANAVNQALFRNHWYDAHADIAYVAIHSPTGRFGGLRTANVQYAGWQGVVGIYAPGIRFGTGSAADGPVYFGDVRASAVAEPMLVTGQADDARVTGGTLAQPNGRRVIVAGIEDLPFVAGTDSHGQYLPAARNLGVLVRDGVNVTFDLPVY